MPTHLPPIFCILPYKTLLAEHQKMSAPIQLYLPAYYNHAIEAPKRLIRKKTQSLMAGDQNQTLFAASIVPIATYQCTCPEISAEYRSITTHCFHRDYEKQWTLALSISQCPTYAHSWNDAHYHFSFYWLVLSSTHMLQLFGWFEPPYAQFYKQHFNTLVQNTEIDLSFDFAAPHPPATLFDCHLVPTAIKGLQDLMIAEQQQQAKAQYLETHLVLSHPDFYTVLETELEASGTVEVPALLCTDWNLYYDLYNPENFSNPDSTIEWEDNSGLYDYYETPYTDATKVQLVCEKKPVDFTLLKQLIDHKTTAEQRLLAFFEHYTFGNGGAYADAIHYQYAKIEIERLHQTTYTNAAFLKRNLCLEELVLEDKDRLALHFACSWDTEHGMVVFMDRAFNCSTDD